MPMQVHALAGGGGPAVAVAVAAALKKAGVVGGVESGDGVGGWVGA